MSVTDDFLDHNRRYAERFDKWDQSPRPRRRVAIVGCMDARLDLFAILGLEAGDAHIIRNADGVVTEDVIRSLTISQRLLGTEEVVLVHHTDCGMLTIDEDRLKDEIEQETGERPPFAFEAFADLAADVRESMARIRASAFLPSREAVRGFVYDVKTGRLAEVE